MNIKVLVIRSNNVFFFSAFLNSTLKNSYIFSEDMQWSVQLFPILVLMLGFSTTSNRISAKVHEQLSKTMERAPRVAQTSNRLDLDSSGFRF